MRTLRILMANRAEAVQASDEVGEMVRIVDISGAPPTVQLLNFTITGQMAMNSTTGRMQAVTGTDSLAGRA
jgi:hypothetical protein